MMENSPTVAIIMSAYNAERFIQEQILSILSQHNADVRLWIRNDGSTDNTLAILREKFGNDPRVVIRTGENLGAAESFLQAIFECELECDYYGFSDADDVWVENKLSLSIEHIGHSLLSKPVAVATQLSIVDVNLKEMGISKPPRLGLVFKNAIIETVASGASVLMNRKAFFLLRSYRPKNVVMHDAWVYLLISALGRFLYLERPTILYRQHDQNVFGTAHGFRQQFKNRLRRIRSKNPYKIQAVEFFSVFKNQLNSEHRKVIENYINYDKSFVTRLYFAIFPSVKFQSWKANMYHRLLIILGRA
jgi:glycosyltransferase involved in cell wall biosynthesis